MAVLGQPSDTDLEELTRLMPSGRVSFGESDRLKHATDSWPAAAKWTLEERLERAPAAVVRPVNTNEVAHVIRWASQRGFAVVPYGGGSGVTGAVVPRTAAISLDTSDLTGVVSVDDEAGQVTVRAGQPAGELERILNLRGRRLPHYPQSLRLATIGGLVATRSSGTFSSKYGNIEDLLVAVEVVLATGVVARTKATPRSSTGPQLANLFVGSEGTLGVITEITLRTLPSAEKTVFRGVSFSEIPAGLAAVRATLDRGVRPAVIRLYDAAEAARLHQQGLGAAGTALLILGFDGAEPVVDAELAVALCESAKYGGRDLGAAIGQAWERTRFEAAWLQDGNASPNRLADAIEVSATWPALAALHGKVLEALAPYTQTSYAHYSHFYPNGASVYFIFTINSSSTEAAMARYRAAWNEALRVVIDLGGSISHHHGVGEVRSNWMATELGSSRNILAAIKRGLDPGNTFNPGKLGLDGRANHG